MLTVNIVAVGKLKEQWLREGLAEYAKRLSGYCRFEVVEIEEHRLPDNPSPAEIERGLAAEAAAIAAKTEKSSIVAMCVEGNELSSPQLAAQLERLSHTTSRLSFVIGGSFGLAEQIKKRAVLRLSVSPMTFPHQLFRVMLAEQLYRAFSINSNTQYHK